MINNNLLSVIIPIYNGEKFLDCCIKSVLEQTYKNIELILVDDGSTDSSCLICQKYASTDNRIKYIFKENGGPGSARNVGIENSTGDFIAFVDCDDWVEQNSYYFLMSEFENNIDAVFGKGRKVYSNKSTQICFSYFDEKTALRGKDVVGKILLEQIGSQPVQCIYRRELWDNVRFENGFYEDIPTTFKVFLNANNVIFTNIVFYNYRMNKKSISHTKIKAISRLLFISFFDRYQYVVSKRELKPYVVITCLFVSHYAITTLVKHSLVKRMQKCEKEKMEQFLRDNKAIVIEHKKELPKKIKFLSSVYYKARIAFNFISLFF